MQALKQENILLPYQRDWASDSSTVKVWEKSRRIGASYGEALLSVLEASKKRDAGGQNTYYLSYNKDMTQGFIKDCAFWAKVLNVACEEMEEIVLNDEKKDITVFRIRFSSGYEICGMPSEPRSLRSKQGRVILDEAAFVEDLAELLKAAFALLMWGGSVSILSTHNGIDNPFNLLVEDIKQGKKPYSLHRTTFNEALDKGLYKKICEVKKIAWSKEQEDAWAADIREQYGDGASEELDCEPRKISNAIVFEGKFEVRAFETPKNAVFYHGTDFGFSPDPLTLVRCYFGDDDKTVYIDQEVYKVGVDIDDYSKFFDVIETTKQGWEIQADNARPECISHMKRRGYNIKATKKWPGSVLDCLMVMKGWRYVIHPRCKYTAEEFGKFAHKIDKATGTILPDVVGKHDHCMDALKYALIKRILGKRGLKFNKKNLKGVKYGGTASMRKKSAWRM